MREIIKVPGLVSRAKSCIEINTGHRAGFAGEIMSHKVWKGGPDTSRKVTHDALGTLISSTDKKIGLRLMEQRSGDGEPPKPVRFRIVDISGVEKPVLQSHYQSFGYDEDSLKFKLLEMFPDEERKRLGLEIDNYRMGEEGETLAVSMKIGDGDDQSQSSDKLTRFTEIYPNEHIRGFAFIIDHKSDGVFEGEIFPLNIPGAINYYDDGDWVIRNEEKYRSRDAVRKLFPLD